MAERRMFAKSIVLSDAFLDMPMSARCLYFTLGMLADDDGFVNAPRSIMRQCGASDDDMKILLAKKYVLLFESGVIVIKHWRINNYLRNDRYTETGYTEEKARLTVEQNRSYHLIEDSDSGIPNSGIPSIDKGSIDKSSIDKGSSKSAADDFCDDGLAKVMDFAFSRINPSLSQGAISDLKFFYELLGADVTIHAMQVALDEKKTSWSYIRAILNRYRRDGLDSLQKVMEAEERRNIQKTGKTVQVEEPKPVDMEALKDLLDQI